MSWNMVRLGEVADLKTGFPFKSSRYAESETGLRLLRGDNVVQNGLRWDGVKWWPQNAVNDVRDYLLRENDVVLAMDRPWIEAGLKHAFLRAQDLPALLVQRVARLRGTRLLDARFLHYTVASAAFTEHVLTVQTGTAVPHISGRDIKAFEFLLPPVSEQQAIAGVLGALDDKIELNRRMNATLEAMARALFRSWFVDFDPIRAKAAGDAPAHMDGATAALFPDRFGEDGLPEGWSSKGLDEIAEFLNGLALQKFPADPEGPFLPAIKIAELRNGVSAKSGRTSPALPAKYVIQNGDVLFSWSGSLVQKVWVEGPGALNQHLFKVSSKIVPKWFHFFAVDQHLEDFQAIAASKATTMGHIQRHHLRDAKVAVPAQKLMDALDKIVGPLFERMVRAELESRSLAALRDALLPKLMSGELRVREAEAQVAEAV